MLKTCENDHELMPSSFSDDQFAAFTESAFGNEMRKTLRSLDALDRQSYGEQCSKLCGRCTAFALGAIAIVAICTPWFFIDLQVILRFDLAL